MVISADADAVPLSTNVDGNRPARRRFPYRHQVERSVTQRSWYKRAPNQARTANQTTDIANPTAGTVSGHLLMIFVNADLIDLIDCNSRRSTKRVLRTRSLKH